MIHLTSQSYSPKEIIQTVYSPIVGALTSPLADDICFKNNLSFVELVQPFCRLSSDAHFRDVSGTSVSIKGLRLNICDVNWRPPQPNLARKLLNESVSSAQCEKNKILTIDENININISEGELWFEQWRETFLTVQFPSEHEYTRHFLACMIVISSSEINALDTANQLTKKIQMMQNVIPPKLPKWFSNDVLICYVMLHDGATGDISKSQSGFESLKMTFGENKCFLIQINSAADNHIDNTEIWSEFLKRHQKLENPTDQDSAPKTPQDISSVTSMPSSVQLSSLEATTALSETTNEEILHPLSPMQETVGNDQLSSTMSTSCDSLSTIHQINPNVWGNVVAELDVPHGMWLTSNDIENIKHFIQDYTIRALIPYVEKQVSVLNELITNKKGVSRSLLSATKRWFVTNKPGVNTTQNAVVYTNESTELQIRKLGDLYFMFGNYNLAFQAYHQAKRDFNADSAWQYYAGALEMAALSAFMQGTSNKKTYDYMEEAIITYLNSCKLPQFATRATLLSAECLKSAKLYGEAAKQLIRMTSEDSDLRSALLLEQASHCFLYSDPALYRKYSFHSVLAGHRFSKAGQRKHAFRCYKQAYQIFENRGWSLAEDHIQYTIGKQAVTLKKLDEASRALAHLLRPSSLQDSKQQYAFLREYIATQKAINQNDNTEILRIALPSIVQKRTKVLVTSPSPVFNPNMIPATNININVCLGDKSKWDKLEEMIVNIATKKQVMFFKPSRSLFTNEFPSSENPYGIHGEPIEISITLENTIKPQILFDDIHLLWTFKKEDGSLLKNFNLFQSQMRNEDINFFENVVSTTSIKSLQLNGQESKNIIIKLTPKLTGTLEITGIVGRISAINDSISLLGQIEFEKILLKRKDDKQQIYDKSLEIIVLPPAPALQINFSSTPFDVLSGEIIPVKMFLTNIGAEILNDIYVAVDDARSILINPENNEMPLSVLKDFRDLTNEKFSKEKETRKQHVFKLFSDNTNLNPKENKITTIWLQAPNRKGQCEINILIYYSMPQGYPKLTHRLIRHSWKFNVIDSIGIEGNCNISNTKTNNIGIDLNIKNINQNQNNIKTEIILNNSTIYCPEYCVNQKKNVIYMNSPGYYRLFSEKSGMKSGESLSMRIPLIEREKSIKSIENSIEFIQNRISKIPIQTIESIENPIIAFSHLGNFLMKFETKYIHSTEQSEEFNNIISNADKHLTIGITWKGLIYENGVFIRSTYGQNFLQLRYLYETISSLHSPLNFTSQDQMFSIYDFKWKTYNMYEISESDWAIHNISAAQRCFIDDENFKDFQDVDLKNC